MVRQDSSMQILLSVLGVISLILITVGVSFAFFTYENEVEIENDVNDGKISLIYSKNIYSDRGLSITSLSAVDDSLGKQFDSDKYIFDFRILGNSTANSEIPYEITLRKDQLSVLNEKNVKVYLTEIVDGEEKEAPLTISYGKVRTFDTLTQTDVIKANEEIEKVIYQGVIPANTSDYQKSFRLRIWVSDESGNLLNSGLVINEIINSYFKVDLNVYTNVTMVSKGEIVSATELIFSDVSPMVVGSVQEIKAVFHPITTTDKSLVWTSSHPEVISIKENPDGSIYLVANSAGSSVIRACSSNGIIENVTVTVSNPVAIP